MTDAQLRLGQGSRKEQQALQHATFAVALEKEVDGFPLAGERAVMKVRLAQMRAPNVSFGPMEKTHRPKIPTSFCDIDQKRVRAVDLEKELHGPEELEFLACK